MLPRPIRAAKATALSLIGGRPCLICLDISHGSQTPITSLCSHPLAVICKPCILYYTRAAVRDNKTTINCPVATCPNTLSLNDVARLADKSTHAMLARRLAAAAHVGEAARRALDDPSWKAAIQGLTIRLCPRQDCRAPIEKAGGCEYVHCWKCDALFDFGQAGIDPVSYKGNGEFQEGGSWFDELVRMLAKRRAATTEARRET